MSDEPASIMRGSIFILANDGTCADFSTLQNFRISFLNINACILRQTYSSPTPVYILTASGPRNLMTDFSPRTPFLNVAKVTNL
jgi:hypothetical protein